jgi:histidinol-phosphate aminotransferase
MLHTRHRSFAMNLSRRALLSASAVLVARPTLAFSASTAVVAKAPTAAEPLVLCWNENPYGPSPQARIALNGTVSHTCRYPEHEIEALQAALVAKEGMSADHIITGSGSGELLSALGALVGREGGEIVAAEPTFLELPEYAKRAGATVKFVPVDAKQCHDLGAMRAAVGEKTRAVYLCNPNNPTGTTVSSASIRDFVGSLPESVTTIVDEAYLDFADDPAVQSMTDLIGAGKRVVVLRTFSKIHGMAGVRCGYAMAQPDMIVRMNDVRMSTPSIFAMRAALASLGDHAFLTDTRRRVIASRKRIEGQLDRLGMPYAKAQGNFVFFDTGMPIGTFQERMLERHIRVGRRFPPFDNWCRITVGTEPQVETFLAALRAIAAESRKVG